ncbi:MAG TPA: peptidase MA family metallohydrolase [Polyangiaceae bacterium]|jgi:hypothetical protein|nr:peptidase MA family metallohydrolase [Polyangiaceae bacterium]
MRPTATQPLRRRFLLSLLALVIGLVAVLLPAAGRADEAGDNELPPRDVSVVVQPAAVSLGPVPSEFQRIDAGWIVFEFPGSARSRVEPLVHEAEGFRARLAEDLGQPVLAHALVRVARTPDQMNQLSPRGAPPPEYAAAVAYPSEHLVLLSMQAPYTWEGTDLVELLGHELAHVALSDAVADHAVPRWFNEGLAIHESGEIPWARTKTLWDASLSRRLLPLTELDQSLPTDRMDVSIAYAEAADVVRFLMRDADRARFGSLIERVRGGAPFERALGDAYDSDIRKLEYEWREEVARRFGYWPVLTGGGLLWVLISALAVAAWVKKRRRAKAQLAQWAREEAEVDAAIAAARNDTLSPARPQSDPLRDEPVPQRIPSVPVVEHEGRWYTLH